VRGRQRGGIEDTCGWSGHSKRVVDNTVVLGLVSCVNGGDVVRRSGEGDRHEHVRGKLELISLTWHKILVAAGGRVEAGEL